jgi:hypothetical protein
MSRSFESMQEDAADTQPPVSPRTVPWRMPLDVTGDKEAMDLSGSYYAIPEDQRVAACLNCAC